MPRAPLPFVILGLALPLPAQWAAPAVVTSLSSAQSDVDPALANDGLAIYFASGRVGGQLHIFQAIRPSPFSAWGAPTQITELASTASDCGPWVSVDRNEMYFCSSRAGGAGDFDIWRAIRHWEWTPFDPAVNVAELNSPAYDGGPSLTTDRIRVYFCSNRVGGSGGFDLWTASRPHIFAAFSTPVPVAELNTALDERDPTISADGLVIAWASEQGAGAGQTDLWMASRLSVLQPFSNPRRIATLSSSAVDTSPGLSLFGDEIYWASERPGGQGLHDLWSSRFTGLLGYGAATLFSTMSLRYSDPGSPGLPYVGIAALGTSPGIPIDTRVLPLNPDVLFGLSIGGLPPVLNGYLGTLGADGIATGSIRMPVDLTLISLRFFNAFLTIDPLAPSSVRTISNGLEVLVQ